MHWYLFVPPAVRFIQDSSPPAQKAKVAAMTEELSAALEGMLASAEPHWLCLRPPASQRSSSSSSSSGVQNSIWLLNVPLLLEQNAELRNGASYLLPAHVSKALAAAAAAAAAAPAATELSSRQQRGSGSSSADDNHRPGTADSSAAEPHDRTAAAAATNSFNISTAEAAVALESVSFAARRTTTAAPDRSAIAAAAPGRSRTSNSAATAAAAAAASGDIARARAARMAALYGPQQAAKRGPAASLDYSQHLPGLGPVQVCMLHAWLHLLLHVYVDVV
jgi:hypothetical protein